MKRPHQNQPDDEPFDFWDRIIAAVLAPVVFNFSVLVVLAVVFKRSTLAALFFLTGPVFNAATIVLVLVPVIVGFVFGTNGVANLLGHSFYTHLESKRDARVTAAIWIAIFLAAYWIENGR